MTTLISAEHIDLAYHGQPVLADVSLEVAEGESVVILGPSGAGKSSLLRCLAGIEDIADGAVTFRSAEILRKGSGQPRLRGDIGMVFQQFNLFPHLSAVENVALAPRRVRRLTAAQAREEAEASLSAVGLSDRMHYYPHELSGGQQQRVAIARALAMKPRLMLFDEPTSALDPEYTREVLGAIRNVIASGMTVVIVTHEMRFAKDTADRVVFMDAGRIVESNTVEKFFTDAQSERARRFLEQTRADA